MLQPKRTKYRKQMRNWRCSRGFAQRGGTVSFGDYGLQSTDWGKVNSRQIEAARRTITRAMKRAGEVWIRIFPDKPMTKKPLEVRQGKGKGPVESWVAPVKPGTVMFEIGGVSEEIAREAFTLAAAKLPVKAHLVKRTVI